MNVEIGLVRDLDTVMERIDVILPYCIEDCLATMELIERWYLQAHTIGLKIIDKLDDVRDEGRREMLLT